MLSGIDVSKHNGTINWKSVKPSGFDFAMIREGYGVSSPNQVDSRFHENIKNAQKAGIYCGVYHYSYAVSTTEAVKEAKFCLENIKGYQLEYPVAFDIEDASLLKLTTRQRTDICKAFCETIEDAGYYVMIYANLDWFRTKLFYSELSKDYDIWLAQWQISKPSLSCGIWQTSSNGQANGISGPVDFDVSYKDYPKIMKNKHLNNF